MRRTIRFLASRADPKNPSEDWEVLKEDYESIQTEVTEHGERLEAMVPLVTSAASLIESRRSLSETANVTRLTILAIVFIPLSYGASIFSMSEDFGPGGSLFWVYFVTAVPLAIFIGLIARPPVIIVKKVLQLSGIYKML
jgi:Mg2+ and Co2+ transporter CorA